MKELELNQLETISGGDYIAGVCAGLAVGATVYMVGVLANWWNPVGWGGTAAMVVVGGACAVYSISTL